MDESRFWSLLDAARTASKGDQDAFCEALDHALSDLPPAEIAAFDKTFCSLLDRAYRWDLWAAAYLMDGGCSDDGFEYFRAWLIALGKKFYESALADPDTLAAAPWTLADEGAHEFESLLYIAPDVYARITGKDELVHHLDRPAEPAGENFDFDDVDEMRRRFPKLAAKHLEADE